MRSKPIHPPLEAQSWATAPNWERLDDISDGVFDCPHTTPKLTGYGPFVVRSQDIRTGIFRHEDAARVSEETYKERIARAEPRHGDLLYSREGTYFGIAAEIPRGERACLGQRMVLIRPNRERIDTRFLRYWLNSPVMARHLEGFRDGSVAERLNLPTIRGLAVPVLPLPEQQAIAAVLGALDDKIELNRRMSATLEEMARALFRSWFVDFDPVHAKARGEAPAHMDAATAALFPDSFGEHGLPDGWSMSVVGAEFDLTMGQSPPGNTYNDDGVGLPFFQGRTDFGFRYPENRKFCSAPTRIAEAKDTLVSVRAPVGDINQAWERCCVGRGVAAIRHRTGQRSYTFYAVQSLQEQLREFEHTGTVFGAINKSQFEALKVAAPTPEVISAYEGIGSSLDARLRTATAESRTLAALRDTLLPKLMSGELRVRDAERQIAEAV
ncbi:restriction endonuclease subunit S [Amaricoccus sp.]|uniref:restriction endonuclease subunit S n=1 Tax=Amaricoccus sp. TaxID=1872485 RepID=UPI0026376EFB|nr:restriction endonuclease subunit S [uncultured Amaricoccus sp.]